MPSSRRAPWRRRAATAVLAAGALLLAGCSGSASGGASGDQVLTIPREDMGTFSRNFNPFSPNVAPMTQQAVYESMLVYNPADGSTTPWLATSWEAAEDGRSVTYTLREGVKWSDGEPFTAEDVTYTFELHQELLGGYPYVESVTAEGAGAVRFEFNEPFSPGLYELGQQIIIPRHIWEGIEDPANDTNGTPVGTGPYTEVVDFQAQSFQLGKNPHYWQPDKQRIEGIRLLAFAGNDGANLATINGEVDWAQSFIPEIEDSFVGRDPEHRHYWFPSTGSMINWQLNTAKAPFDDVDVRRALSMAIDRETITEVGMNGYTDPADCTGLSGNYDTWRAQAVVTDCDWTRQDVDEANRILDEAGYERDGDGRRRLPDGSPFAFDIAVGSASSDWLSVADIISQDLERIGVSARVQARDWGQVTADYEDGSFDTGIVWSNNAPTPYQFYRGTMSSGTVKPVGERTLDNYHRFADEEADALLDEFAATFDEEEQRAVATELQARFAELAPVVPLFPGPEWGEYLDSRFTGWPTEDDPYATLSNRSPTTVLVLTSLRPVTD